MEEEPKVQEITDKEFRALKEKSALREDEIQRQQKELQEQLASLDLNLKFG